ncbi:MAG: hypothetical protein KAJ00_00145, partial [Deltaproteobacteria bacterium]|nr:hypothetical protein [Deltaproteobacteria bacterium]
LFFSCQIYLQYSFFCIGFPAFSARALFIFLMALVTLLVIMVVFLMAAVIFLMLSMLKGQLFCLYFFATYALAFILEVA